MTLAEQHAVILKWRGLPVWFLRRFILGHPSFARIVQAHREDLLQELAAVMVHAAKTFDPAISSFTTYCMLPMANTVEAYIQTHVGPVKHRPSHRNRGALAPTNRSDDDVGAVIDADPIEPDRDTAIDAQLLVEDMRRTLPSKRKRDPERVEALIGELRGEIQDVAARRFGVSRERVRQWIEEIRPEFERFAAKMRSEA